MSQIAADTFGVSRDYVEIVNADTALVPNSDIQGASRATFFVGGAAQQAANLLLQPIYGVAAEILDVPVGNLRVEADHVIALDKNSLSVSLAEIAQEFEHIGLSRRVAGCFDISESLTVHPRPEYIPLVVTGAHLADVLVDMETGIVTALRVVAAHDVGRVVNPLGAALSEEYIPGQTGGLSQYLVPMIGSMPEIKTILVEVPSRLGPYGVKGLGEAAMLPSTPAIINAVSRAIGTRIRSVPATSGRILSAIGEAKRQ